MLTSLEIENFKSVATRQRVEFAPLTLLFGANNAGKSTVLHALIYMHELLERGTADVDRTELGGTSIELGGFARLVHRHDLDRSIVLRAEFDTKGSLSRFGRDLSQFPFVDLDDDVESAWLELRICRWSSPGLTGPLVDRAVVGVNGSSEPLVSLSRSGTIANEPLYAQINFEHALLQSSLETRDAWSLIAASEHVAVPTFGVRDVEERGRAGDALAVAPRTEAAVSRPVFAVASIRNSALPAPSEPLLVFPLSGTDSISQDTANQVRTFLEMVVLGTTAHLASFLRESLYIGPLRAIPALGDLYERPANAASWGDGRASWQELVRDGHDLVERTNAWLGRLGADCRVFVTSVFEQNSSDGDATTTRTHTLRLETRQGTRVLPAEVGAGVSQMVPVVVAAALARGGAIAVEQPELHVHPALQTGLGDLFIEAATREWPRRLALVETHSEHLILRVLRRIRETSEDELPEGTKSFTSEDLSVIYVESTPDGTRFRRLRVDAAGEFVDRWPQGFFGERMRELL